MFCFGFGQVAKNFIKKINAKNVNIKLTVTSRENSDQKVFDGIKYDSFQFSQNSFDKSLLRLYFIHLFFNCTWSIVFFGFHQIWLSLINLIIILIFILLLMKKYFKLDKLSFYLMSPYLLWSTYALILNVSIFLLN